LNQTPEYLSGLVACLVAARLGKVDAAHALKRARGYRRIHAAPPRLTVN